MSANLHVAYQKMATDKARESEALAWCEGLIGDATKFQNDEKLYLISAAKKYPSKRESKK